MATYKRVKAGTMRLARVARKVAADMVDGEIPSTGKEFVVTPLGQFRLSMSGNADNTTEAAAHFRMGAIPVVMGDDSDMIAFFALHGLAAALALEEFKFDVWLRLNDQTKGALWKSRV